MIHLHTSVRNEPYLPATIAGVVPARVVSSSKALVTTMGAVGVSNSNPLTETVSPLVSPVTPVTPPNVVVAPVSAVIEVVQALVNSPFRPLIVTFVPFTVPAVPVNCVGASITWSAVIVDPDIDDASN
jgi:hypothetical protein